jgi:hypothetical protein
MQLLLTASERAGIDTSATEGLAWSVPHQKDLGGFIRPLGGILKVEFVISGNPASPGWNPEVQEALVKDLLSRIHPPQAPGAQTILRALR